MDRQTPSTSHGTIGGGKSRRTPSSSMKINVDERAQRTSPRAEYLQHQESTPALEDDTGSGDSFLNRRNAQSGHDSRSNDTVLLQPEYRPGNDYTLLGMNQVCSDFATTDHIYKMQDYARERKLQSLKYSSFKDLKIENYGSHDNTSGGSSRDTRSAYFGKRREPRIILNKAESESERQRSIVRKETVLDRISRSIEMSIDSGNTDLVYGPQHPLQANIPPINSSGGTSQAKQETMRMSNRRTAQTGNLYRDPFMPHQARLLDEFD